MPASAISKGQHIADLRNPRVKRTLQESVRANIQVTKILNFIQDHVLNGTEVATSRIHYGMKLIDKILPNAIPDAVTNNLQANTALAIQSLTQAQLMAMARELMQQQDNGIPIEHNSPAIEGVCEHSLTVEIPTESERSMAGEKKVGGYGKGGVPIDYDESNPSPTQNSLNPYHILPDELG